MIRILVVSAHPDDAVLSLGGLLSSLIAAQCLCVTVFSRSAYVRSSFRPTQDISSLRQEEDSQGLAAIGTEARWLHHPDASLRNYTATSEISSAIDYTADDIGKIAEELRRQIDRFRPHICLAPQAYGNHVDHEITRQAWFKVGWPLERTGLYSDFPYAVRQGRSPRSIPKANGLEHVLFAVPPLHLMRKIRALRSYQSQFGKADIFQLVRHPLCQIESLLVGRECRRILQRELQ